MYGKVEDVKSTQEPRYCVLRGTKEDLTSRLFPGLGKAESQYTANGQLSSKGNFKPFDGGRERYNLSSRSKPIPSLSYSGSWQGDFHTYLSWESCSLGPVKGKNSRRRSSPGSLLLSCLRGGGFLDMTTPPVREASHVFLLSLDYWSCLLPLFLQTLRRTRFPLTSPRPCSEHLRTLCSFLCDFD